MILDLKTQEPYAAVLYQDATDVIFAAAHGESQISAKQFREGIDLVEEGGLVWGRIARYQLVGHAFEDEPAHRVRRGQLARYAAVNGGQIHTHTQVKRPRSWAQRLLGTADFDGMP